MKYFKLSEIVFALASFAMLLAVGLAAEEKPEDVDPRSVFISASRTG